MAGFKTHITTSTVVGIGYGAAGYWIYDVNPATCVLATGLCSIAGMLPDLDSDQGVPLRESVTFAAAFVPMLLVDRLRAAGLETDLIVLTSAMIYIVIRFGLAEILKRYTVHRGMWHSIPAAAIAGLIGFLLCTSNDGLLEHLFKTVAVILGFMTHLILDEIWSIEWKGTLPRFKKSFGTALKFWSKNTWANLSTYGKLVILIVLVVLHMNDHMEYHNQWQKLQSLIDQWKESIGNWETRVHP